MRTSTGRGRPRLPQTEQRILQTARDLLRDKGPTALSIEAVATHSGVARTTIYRRYRDRQELLTAALEGLIEGPLPPPELSIEEKLRWILNEVTDLFEHGLGRGGTGTVLMGTDPDFTAALRGQIEERVRALRGLVEADVDTGRLARHVDPETLIGLLLGAYLGEVLRHGQPREGWLDSTVHFLTRATTKS